MKDYSIRYWLFSLRDMDVTFSMTNSADLFEDWLLFDLSRLERYVAGLGPDPQDRDDIERCYFSEHS